VYPPRLKPRLTIAVPTSIVASIPLLKKTIKLSYLARFSAIFRVEKIIIFLDPFDEHPLRNFKLMKLILEYISAPPYLRKYLFKLNPLLRYVGLASPLKTPDHQPEIDLEKEEITEIYRKGIVVGRKGKGVLVDVGLKEPVYLRGNYKKGSLVTIRFSRKHGELRLKTVPDEDVPIYWGFKVYGPLTVRKLLREIDREGYLTIATSRRGRPITSLLDKLSGELKKSGEVVVIFGGPRHGLHDIFNKEGLNLEDEVEWIINFAPFQGTETIRTEEAIGISLALLNIILPGST